MPERRLEQVLAAAVVHGQRRQIPRGVGRQGRHAPAVDWHRAARLGHANKRSAADLRPVRPVNGDPVATTGRRAAAPEVGLQAVERETDRIQIGVRVQRQIENMLNDAEQGAVRLTVLCAAL